MQILRHPDGSLVAACKYRSTDEGITWNRIPGGGSASFSILPDGTLFQPAGLSSDWGNTWTPIGYAGGGRGHIQAVGSDFAGNLYIASRTGYASNGIFFRSTDRGQHWTKLWSSDSRNGFVQNVVVSPHGDIYAGGGTGGLSYSTDSGKTWTGMEWGSGWCSVTPTMTRGEIFMGTDWGYTARSTEYGSWVMSRTPIAGDATIYTFCFTNDSTEVLAGTSDGVYASTDRGLTWEKRSQELDFRTVYTLKTLENGDILAGTYTGGIVRSEDRGRTWTDSKEGCTGMQIQTMMVDRSGSVYASSEGMLYRSQDHGRTWRVINSTLPVAGTDYKWFQFRISALASDMKGNLYLGTPQVFLSASASYPRSILYYSPDEGLSWEEIPYPVGIDSVYKSIITSIAVNDVGWIFLGDQFCGVYRTKDFGKNWEQILRRNLDSNYTWVEKIYWSEKSRYLIAGYYGRTLISTDQGDSWRTQAPIGFKDIGEDDRGWLYVVSPSFIYLSTDQGISWDKIASYAEITNEENNGSFTSISIEGNRNIFIGTTIGNIYCSTNSGRDWQRMQSGIPAYSGQITDLVIDGEGYLYAASFHSSVLRSIDPILTSADETSHPLPTVFSLYPPFPNPFNPSTTISYSLPHAEHVSLTVYDVLGREIITLVNEKKEAGNYQVTWNADNSPSGIYLCRMKAGEYGEMRKLLLLK